MDFRIFNHNKIAAVVVTYNRKALLRQCLDCLMKQEKVSCDILVVDNASSDGTSEWLREQEKNNSRVYAKKLLENTGGAGGFNYGMRWAVEAGYDYVWVMDDDTMPTPNALAELLCMDRLLNGQYGFLSSMVFWKDETCCLMNRQAIGKSFFENIDHLLQGLVAVEQATFVSLLFKSEIIQKVGLPIKEYFIWNDDIEYTRRIAVRTQIPSYLVASSKVYHWMENNNGSDISLDSIDRIGRYKYAARNEFFTYRQEALSGMVRYWERRAKDAAKILICAKNHRLQRMCTLIRGIWQGFFFRPKIESVNTNSPRNAVECLE